MYNNFIEYVINIIGNLSYDFSLELMGNNYNVVIFSMLASLVIFLISFITKELNQFKHFEGIVKGTFIFAYISEAFLLIYQGIILILLNINYYGILFIVLGLLQINLTILIFIFISKAKQYFSIPE